MEQRDYQTITASVEGHVFTLTLNIPERKNPLGPAMVNELLWALDDATEAPEVRVIVLTGAGKAFSAGGDLKQMGGKSSLERKGDYADLLLRLSKMTKPCIARVPGPAMGGGLGLVASCHFAVACESAVIGTPEIKRGLFPMMIMAVLQRVVPRRKLVEMMLLGDKMSAAQGMELGLLNRVVADEGLDEAVAELTDKLVSRSPTAMRMGLEAFSAQADLPLEKALPHLNGQLMAILKTEDAREGLMAFMQKRDPVWTGR